MVYSELQISFFLNILCQLFTTSELEMENQSSWDLVAKRWTQVFKEPSNFFQEFKEMSVFVNGF